MEHSSAARPFVRGSLWGLSVGTFWMVGEALWMVTHHQDVEVSVIPLYLGVAAPWLVLLAALAGFGASGLLPWLKRHAPSDQVARAWLFATGEDARRASARIVAGLFGAALFAAGTVVTGLRIWAQVATPAFAVALLLLVQLLLAGTLGLLAPAAVGQLMRLSGWAPRFLWRPIAPLAVSAVALGAAVAVAMLRFPHVVQHLPWRFIVPPLVALLLAASLEVMARRGNWARRLLLWLNGAMMAGLLGCSIWSLFAVERFDPERRMLLTHPSVGRAWLGATRALLDVDGDGSLGFYGEGDCRPFDPASGPHQIEIPLNGVDEDCSGRDLTIDPRLAQRGQSHHEPPRGGWGDLTERPHVFLITTDALSFRHTGIGGYDRRVTPNLDAWAQRATVFRNAFSVGPETATSFPALFAGTYTSRIPSMYPYGLKRNDEPHYPVTLAQALSRRGYRTHAIVGNEFFLPKSWPAVTHGFDEVDGLAIDEAKQRYRQPKAHTSPEVTEHAIAHLDAHRQEGPMMMWVHYFDHHPFYVVPRGETPFGDGRSPKDRYDTELRYTDRHWGRLLEAIEERFEPDEYVVVFTADHGEAFDANHPGEAPHHAHCLRTEEVQVPFILQAPRRRGHRVNGLVSLLDVAPTLLDLTGTTLPHELAGESLAPVLFEGREVEKNVVFAHVYDPRQAYVSQMSITRLSVRTTDRLYIHDRENHLRQVFRWRDDSLDLRNVSLEEPDQAEWLGYLATRELQRMLQPLR